MTTEELINHIHSSGLFDDAEIMQWTQRIQKEGITETLIGELTSDIQLRIEALLKTMGITNTQIDAYKQLLLDFHGELKGIAKDYREGGKQLNKEVFELVKETDVRDAKKHIEESKAAIADIDKEGGTS